MLAKQELTGTSTQRSNNREKTEKMPTKTNGHRTSRTTTIEQKEKTSPTRQDPPSDLTQMNLHEEHHQGRRLRPRKQPEGGQASTRRSSSIAAKHPPETTYKGGKVSAEPSETGK